MFKYLPKLTSGTITIKLGPFYEADGVTPHMDPILANRIVLSKNNGAFASKNDTSLTIPDNGSNGYHGVTFNATDLNTLGDIIIQRFYVLETEGYGSPMFDEYKVVPESVYNKLKDEGLVSTNVIEMNSAKIDGTPSVADRPKVVFNSLKLESSDDHALTLQSAQGKSALWAYAAGSGSGIYLGANQGNGIYAFSNSQDAVDFTTFGTGKKDFSVKEIDAIVPGVAAIAIDTTTLQTAIEEIRAGVKGYMSGNKSTGVTEYRKDDELTPLYSIETLKAGDITTRKKKV